MELRHDGVERITQVNIGANYSNYDCNRDTFLKNILLYRGHRYVWKSVYV